LRILTFGGWFGSENIGDSAILIGLKEILQITVPDAELTALSINPEYTKKTCDVLSVRLQSPRNLLNRTVREKYWTIFRDSDVYILTGGTPIYDYGHMSRIIHLGIPNLQRKVLICFGIGVKPLKTPHGRRLVSRLLSNASLISARDRSSQRTLSNLLGRKISLIGDTALYMEPAKRREAEPILDKIGRDRPIVAFCPRHLSLREKWHYHEPLTMSDIWKIRHIQAKTADHLNRKGYNLVFIPFHKVGIDNDYTEIEKIRMLMKTEQTTVLKEDLTPQVMMKLLGYMELVIGLRLHSLVFAAAMGTPFSSISYDTKIVGFIEMTGMKECLVHPAQSLEKLSKTVDNICSNKLRYVEILKESCELMKNRIRREALKMKYILS
jgi:polysaccharide pyruvyl transferase WcaK-like protein